MKKFSLKAILIALLVICFQAQPVSAGYVNATRYINGYSLAGLHVLNVTFHASGYSNPTSGSVTNMYFTDWAWFPNTISDRKTWTSSIPYGQRANGSVLIGVGVNSPWGAVNLFGGQKYLSIDF